MKVIASLCPWPVGINRPLFAVDESDPNSCNSWSLPAVPRGSPPATIEIHNQTQWEKIFSMRPATPTTITAAAIAADFILHVALSGPFMTEDAHPPIWICEGDAPTPEEITENLVKFERYCDLVVAEGDEWHTRRKAGEPRVPKHTQRQKDCARFMLYDREWLSDFTPHALKQCQFCTTTIPSAAVICPTCTQVVDKAKFDELKKAASVAGQFPAKVPQLAAQ